jgi:hypothetical protein
VRLEPFGSSVRSIRSSSSIAGLVACVSAALVVLLLVASSASAQRGYELVTPLDKNGFEPVADPNEAGPLPLISPDGSAVVYGSLSAIGGTDPVSNGVGNYYRARRDASGWTSRQLSSLLNPVNMLGTVEYQVFSQDLSLGIQAGPFTPPATPDAEDGVNNLYLTDGTSQFRLITKGLPGWAFSSVQAVGGSDDLDTVVYSASEYDPTGEVAPFSSPQIFAWDASTEETELVARMPGGEPAPQTASLAGLASFDGPISVSRNPISADGSRIFFYTPTEGANRQLYVRIDGAVTKQVSASQRTESDPLAPKAATFQFAADEGSVVYFTSAEKLTDDATTGPEDLGKDLFRYHVDSGTLTDITVDPGDMNGAEVRGVLGGSADGSRVYFVAKGVLDAGATAGADNLYSWVDDGSADGEVTFIATGLANSNWEIDPLSLFEGRIASRVTPDGEHLLFHSSASLTGYPNAGFEMVYLYDAASGEISCASCNPANTPATAFAIAVGAGESIHIARSLSDDGRRVFFTTAERLVDADTNSAQDVYEYDAALGEITLLSAGKGQYDTRFSDATPDGSSAVFVTRERLVGVDKDANYDVYDARIGGGLASQNPPPPPPPCAGLDCRGSVPALPPAPVPGSALVDGPGDPKAKHKKKRKKRKQARRHKKSAKKQQGNAKHQRLGVQG